MAGVLPKKVNASVASSLTLKEEQIDVEQMYLRAILKGGGYGSAKVETGAVTCSRS